MAFETFHLQPPGELREHHLGDIRQEMSKSKFKMNLIFCLPTKSLDFLTVDIKYTIQNNFSK